MKRLAGSTTSTISHTARKVNFISYQTEEEVHSALIEVVVFAVYLIVCTILALHSQSIYGFHTNNALKHYFVRTYVKNEFVWKLDRITSLELWWKYLNHDFINLFYHQLKFPPSNASNLENDPLRLHTKPYFWDSNILLHPPRIRQVRVKPVKCKNLFVDIFPENCYGAYSPSNHEDEPYFKGSKYVEPSKTNMESVWATVERYNLGEYIYIIPYKAVNITMENLENMKWVDRGTRLILLTIETYNYNMGSFTLLSLLTEILPTGNVVVALDAESTPLYTIWDTTVPGIIFTACVFYIITTYYLANEIYEIYKFGFRNYFQIIWNYFDWGIIMMSYISLIFSITHLFNVEQYLHEIEIESDFATLDKVNLHNQIYTGAVALGTFQMWIRIFRFISFNETMLHFNMTLKRCAPEILGFALILLIFFIIFAIVGLLNFGNKHPDFLNFNYAFFFMFRLMMHDFDYDNFSDVDALFGPLFFMSYVVVVVFVLVNMFLAIISLNYTEVKQLPSEGSSAIKTVYVNFKKKLLHFLKNLKIKLAKKGRLSIIPRDSSKSVAFEEKELSQRELEEDDALKEYFGFKPTESNSSIASSASSYKSIAYESDEDPNDESRNAKALDHITSLNQRLNQLDKEFRKLEDDMDLLLSTIDNLKQDRPSETTKKSKR